jgi:hypothetical protein
MEERICEEEISRGNSWEAISCWLYSSSSKPTANLTASEALVSFAILRLLTLGRIGEFATGCISKFVSGGSIEFRRASKTGGPIGRGLKEGREFPNRSKSGKVSKEVKEFEVGKGLEAGNREFLNGLK